MSNPGTGPMRALTLRLGDELFAIEAENVREILDLVPITGENRMAYLATGKADVLLSVGQTPEREKVLDFSRPYAPYYLAVFGPKSLPVKSETWKASPRRRIVPSERLRRAVAAMRRTLLAVKLAVRRS